jgi:hypothetical protein
MACLAFALAPAKAQCVIVGQSGSPLPHLQGTVAATVQWDPDGAGPAGLQLAVAGARLAGGNLLATGVAAYDGSHWLPLGTPPTDVCSSLGVHNGQLVGAFEFAGPVLTQVLAAWNGTSWQTIGSCQYGRVEAMTVYNGELVIAGDFAFVDNLSMAGIARWNGTTWSSLGAGVVGRVLTLAVYSGLLYAGGDLTQAGGLPVSSLASWSGTTWSPVGNPNGTVRSLAVRNTTSITTSYLFAGGLFTTIGGFAAQHVARYNAATNSWTALGAGLPGVACRALYVRATGLSSYELTAATEDLAGANQVLRWSGSVWNTLGGTLADVPRTLIYFGGRYLLGQAATGPSLRTYDGATWAPVAGPGLQGTVFAILDQGADIVVGGSFATISGVTMNGLARGDVGAWSPLGAGVDGAVYALARAANGDVIAGGDFTTAGGQPANHVARWNGSTWAPLGVGTTGPVYALATMPNGDLVVGGTFAGAGGGLVGNVARWNGTSWLNLGGGVNGTVRALLAMPGGDLYVGGDFTAAGVVTTLRLARTDGVLWFPVGTGMDGSVRTLATMPNGDLAVGGDFVFAGGAHSPKASHWNGAYWSRFHSLLAAPLQGNVHALGVLPDNDVVAGGAPGFIGAATSSLARSQDSAWTSLSASGGEVRAVVARANGELLVGGNFTAVGGITAGGFAHLGTSCPATATTSGSGCPSSGGSNTLTATTLPWVDATFRATGTGLPVPCYVLSIYGLSPVVPALPLHSVLIEALPGCDLHVTPDGIETLYTATGTVQSQIYLPNTPPLVGVTFYHQMLPVVLDAQSQLLEITSTNALRLTAGMF